MNEELCNNIIDYVIDEVVHDGNSPYNMLLRKVNDIDVDYFENISRDQEQLSDELSVELKDKVIVQFAMMADDLFVNSTLAARLSAVVRDKAEGSSPHLLECVKEALQQYAADRLKFIPSSHATSEELNKKYIAAKELTLAERFLRNNKADVIEFYHALLQATVYECRKLIEERTANFIETLARAL